MSATVSSDELDVESLYRAYAPFLARWIARFLGEGPHVQDLLQDTFVIALRKKEQFEGRSSAKVWLYGIAKNLCWRHRRSGRRFKRIFDREAETPVVVDEGLSPEEQSHRVGCRKILSRVLSRLPPKQREVFILFELEELPGDAIAELLALPLNTVWTRLHHARKNFEKLSAQYQGASL